MSTCSLQAQSVRAADPGHRALAVTESLRGQRLWFADHMEGDNGLMLAIESRLGTVDRNPSREATAVVRSRRDIHTHNLFIRACDRPAQVLTEGALRCVLSGEMTFDQALDSCRTAYQRLDALPRHDNPLAPNF